jgi:hypothetical protein
MRLLRRHYARKMPFIYQTNLGGTIERSGARSNHPATAPCATPRHFASAAATVTNDQSRPRHPPHRVADTLRAAADAAHHRLAPASPSGRMARRLGVPSRFRFSRRSHSHAPSRKNAIAHAPASTDTQSREAAAHTIASSAAAVRDLGTRSRGNAEHSRLIPCRRPSAPKIWATKRHQRDESAPAAHVGERASRGQTDPPPAAELARCAAEEPAERLSVVQPHSPRATVISRSRATGPRGLSAEARSTPAPVAGDPERNQAERLEIRESTAKSSGRVARGPRTRASDQSGGIGEAPGGRSVQRIGGRSRAGKRQGPRLATGPLRYRLRMSEVGSGQD